MPKSSCKQHTCDRLGLPTLLPQGLAVLGVGWYCPLKQATRAHGALVFFLSKSSCKQACEDLDKKKAPHFRVRLFLSYPTRTRT